MIFLTKLISQYKLLNYINTLSFYNLKNSSIEEVNIQTLDICDKLKTGPSPCRSIPFFNAFPRQNKNA